MQKLQEVFGPPEWHAGLVFRTVGRGPAFVLLHGGTGSRTHWARNVAALASHFEVVTVDLPGLGESAAPPAGIEPGAYMSWVADAIELQLRGASYDIAGFSFGATSTAAVSAELAARGLAPRRISLVSPSGFGEPTNRRIALEKQRRDEVTPQAEIRAVTARNLGKWMLAHAPSPEAEAVDIQLANIARARFDSRPFSFRDSLLADLRRAGAPSQVLLGRQDPLIFPSLDARVARIREVLPGARVSVLDGGHWLAYEASDSVDRLLIEFHLSGSTP